MNRPTIKRPPVNLPCPRDYEIHLDARHFIRVTITNPGCGQIHTNLKDETIFDRDSEKLSREQDRYNDQIDVLESFILACACAGIAIDSPAFVDAIQTTVDAIANDQ